MKEIYLLLEAERSLFFRSAAEIQRMTFEIIEKDYWVVWILERLFSLEAVKPYLTFKGGTSLSKVYGLIDRFSEDIDISIERDFFGINNPEDAASNKKQDTAINTLFQTCADFVQTQLLNDLKKVIAVKLGTNDGWNLYIDPEGSDSKTLLFEYPSQTSQTNYIRPVVKIEIGARSEHCPVSDHLIHSYCKAALKEQIYEPEIRIRVLNAERTFWEKATILHQYAHLPDQKPLPSRLSRHYYDFFRLLNSPIKKKALVEADLLDKVTKHKNIYFKSRWASYDTARKGSLKLIPPVQILNDLLKDYVLMQPMFFRDIPEWELITKTIAEFENEFNNAG